MRHPAAAAWRSARGGRGAAAGAWRSRSGNEAKAISGLSMADHWSVSLEGLVKISSIGEAEQFGDPEGERQRGIVAAGLDGVDALARDFEPIGEIALAPVAFGAQHLEAIVHSPLRRISLHEYHAGRSQARRTR